MMKLFAVAAPGLEAVVAAEVRALAGVTLGSVVEVKGGVDFDGGSGVLWAANLGLRCATRVLVRVGVVEARDFARLRAGAAKLPWRDFATRAPRVQVSASAKKCRLYHTGAIAERVEGAIADAFAGAAAADADAAPLDVMVRGEHDRFTFSVDSSGELLHRRGWRVDTAPASLRETLAAGVLTLAGWTPDEPLVDPMCGAGTIVIEAALAALGRAPGETRRFAFEAWPGAARARPPLAPPAPPVTPLPLLLGGERDAKTFELARRNAERAGVAANLTLVHADAARLSFPATPRPGLIVANPPYGKRLGDGASASLAALAALWRRSPGWRLAVLLPDDRAALRLLSPRPPRARHPLDNGGLRVFLNVW
jgi:putative N6-adenine-specific DNA methylase